MIAVVGALDTKADEFTFLIREISSLGHEQVIIDFGPFSTAGPDVRALGARYIGPDEVADAADTRLTDLVERHDRSETLGAMSVGVGNLLVLLADQLDGVVGAGGSGATSVVTKAMRRVNFKCPLVIVSTLASVDIGRYIDGLACAVINPVVDVSGLNSITRSVLASAAASVCAMTGRTGAVLSAGQSRSAISMFGITTPGVDRARATLEKAGLEVFTFHANDKGGISLEMLIGDGVVTSVLDMTTTEMADAVVGGCLPAAGHRFTTAGRLGLPQVVSLGALDAVNFGSVESIPVQFRGRRLLQHTPDVTLMRTTPAECHLIGGELMRRLNESSGPVTLVLPHGGLSTLSVAGGPFHDPEADEALIEAVVAAANPSVELIHVHGSVNDPAVAELMANSLLNHIHAQHQNKIHDQHTHKKCEESR